MPGSKKHQDMISFFDVFSVLTLMLAISGLKLFKPISQINSDFCSQKTCNALKGLFAVVIIFHHYSQVTAEGLLFPGFFYMGGPAVGMFLFITGYGLLKQCGNTADYLRRFPMKRTVSVVVPYLLVTLLYWLASSWGAEKSCSFSELMVSFINGKPFVPYSWYVVFIIIAYAAFWLNASVSRQNSPLLVGLTVLFCILWVAFCRRNAWPHYWFESSFALPAGMLLALFESKITSVLSQGRSYLVCFGLLLLLCVFAFGLYAKNGAEKAGGMIALLFPMMTFLMFMKCRIESPVLNFLGQISYEMYLLHGIIEGFFMYRIEDARIWMSISFLITVISAWIMHVFFDRIKQISFSN